MDASSGFGASALAEFLRLLGDVIRPVMLAVSAVLAGVAHIRRRLQLSAIHTAIFPARLGTLMLRAQRAFLIAMFVAAKLLLAAPGRKRTIFPSGTLTR